MKQADDPDACFHQFCVLNFSDPHAGNLRSHDGRNLRIAERLLNKEDQFRKLVRSVKFHLLNFDEDKSEIAFWCNKGRHRSVACAVLFQMMLAKDYHVEVTHKSLTRHSDRQCSCWQCNNEPFPLALIQRAERVWREEKLPTHF